MRLSADQQRAVRVATQEAFPPGTRVCLFGSRADDQRRGGDIDLLVELPSPLPADEQVARRSRFVARLQRLIEVQRIDVLLTVADAADPRAVVQSARRQAIELAVA
ncbi:MAG: nucleotidyltransferase domain-containing protein [Leptothrix sp. (in: b-proteobacteria)]